MKKTTLIIIITIFSLTAKAQHFSITTDIGMSYLSGLYNPHTSKPQLYYGLGMLYSKSATTTNWGFKTSLDFNKRGVKSIYTGTSYSGYVESKNILSSKSLSLTFTPTLNVSERVQFVLGPHLGYFLSSKSTTTEIVYKTSLKEEILQTVIEENTSNGISFIDRLHFGVKLGINVKVSNPIDLGLTYQYARLLKYAHPSYRPFYNVLSITTTIYFKTRE
jgi:hypothetical protein